MNRTSARTLQAAVAAVFVISLLPTPVAAQSELFSFDLRVAENVLEVQTGGESPKFHGTIQDFTTEVPLAPPGVGVLPHHVELSTTPVRSKLGWVAGAPNPGSFDLHSGESQDFEFVVVLAANADEPYFQINLTATMTFPDGSTKTKSALLTAHTSGIPSFGMRGSNAFQLKPHEVVDTQFIITNLDLTPRAFKMDVGSNECEIGVGLPSQILVDSHDSPGGGVETYAVTLQAPATKVLYLFGDQCNLTLLITPADDASATPRALFYSITVQGANIQFPLIFNVFVVAILLLFFLLFLRRRKEIIEEEILGKPQKPWTIPVEQVYLKHLKQKDERAWYVVRHYLMEDEYSSSLLWYKGYKDATKGARKKERLVLRQERQYERWRKAWERELAKPLMSAAKYESSLQNKLDRTAKGEHRKAMTSWRKTTARLNAVHAKQTTRATEKHEKLVAKAAKKGQPAPPMPVIDAPDLPPQPMLESVALVDHKWATKAARYRAKMVKRQGNLEVRFEKADALKQAKLQRKVARLARKLDDPDFIAEHHIGSTSKQ